MIKIYRDTDADLKHLDGRTVVVVGYGKQGRAQALNLRDSGVSVLIAGDRSTAAAEADGFDVIPIAGCARKADVLLVLVPDEAHQRIYEEKLKADLRAGHVLCFAHGYSFHFGYVTPPPNVDVVMVAPRMVGSALRELFLGGRGAPAYVAVGQNASGRAREVMLALAKGIGCTRAGAVEMSFQAETALDLFLEQTLLPIFTQSMLYAFEVLTEAGFDPGIVTLEMYGSGEMTEIFEGCAKFGLYGQMLQLHSRTAQYGELSRQDRLLPDAVRSMMAASLRQILSGEFAAEWRAEERAGFPRLTALVAAARAHPINEAERAIASELSLPDQPDQ